MIVPNSQKPHQYKRKGDSVIINLPVRTSSLTSFEIANYLKGKKYCATIDDTFCFDKIFISHRKLDAGKSAVPLSLLYPSNRFYSVLCVLFVIMLFHKHYFGFCLFYWYYMMTTHLAYVQTMSYLTEKFLK